MSPFPIFCGTRGQRCETNNCYPLLDGLSLSGARIAGVTPQLPGMIVPDIPTTSDGPHLSFGIRCKHLTMLCCTDNAPLWCTTRASLRCATQLVVLPLRLVMVKAMAMAMAKCHRLPSDRWCRAAWMMRAHALVQCCLETTLPTAQLWLTHSGSGCAMATIAMQARAPRWKAFSAH